jgi:hypothetical protein
MMLLRAFLIVLLLSPAGPADEWLEGRRGG